LIQVELHRHLDVSTRLLTLHELACAQGLIPSSTSLESFRRDVLITQQMTDLREVLAKFSIFQRVLATPEAIERIGFEAVEDCHREGTQWIEYRYAPLFASEYSGLSWKEVLDAFHRGISRAQKLYPDMKVGLLCIASRDFGVEGVEKTVEFFLKEREGFVGFDLAGNEEGNPCRLFTEAFRPLRAAGVPITVHSGEACGPENIWEAIELLGARRIGHGISSIKDPLLVKTLREKKICLEQCPTSNWITRATDELKNHPLPKLLREGVPVTINTDDPGIFNCALPGEIAIARKQFGLSSEEVERCMAYALESSFLN